MATWEQINDRDRVELGIVQVDIAGHSKLLATDRALQEAKSIFRNQMEGIAFSRNGRSFHWAGDGGAFMFLTGDGKGFDDLGFSAIQMLTILPAVNEEIAIRTDLGAELDVRISCDCGVVMYAKDAGEITADFINNFFKHERSIGLTNTVSITERVWKQLTAKLRARFDSFKYCTEVASQIYNYGGKRRQLDFLRKLRNVAHQGRNEQPIDDATFVEITAFTGDTLADLSKYAYGDVLVEGFDNIGGINLLITKNADEYQRNLQNTVTDDKIRLTRQSRDRDHWPDPASPLEGGESLKFLNCTALGYIPLIGDGTLLDHVFAKNLVINRVIGGVPEPVVKERIFEMRRGAYREIENAPQTTSDSKRDPKKR